MVEKIQSLVRDHDKASAAAVWVAAYTFVVVGRVMDLVPGARNLPLAKIAFVGIIAAAIAGRRTRLTVPLLSIRIVRTACALAALTAVSVTFSIWPSESLAFLARSFVQLFIGFLVTTKILTKWADVRSVLKAFALSGIALAAVAVAGYGGGRAAVNSAYDTNDLAYVLVGVLPIGLGFAVTAREGRRIFWYGIVGLTAAAALLTQSRGAFLALLGLGLVLIWRPLRLPEPVENVRRSRLGIARRALVALALATVVWTLLPHDARERLGSVASLSSDYNADLRNRGSRAAIWKRNTIAALERPIGYGIDTFGAVDGRNGGRYSAAHNSAIEMLVELGVIGLLLWLRLWLLSWRRVTPPAEPPAESGAPRDQWRQQVVMARAVRLALLGLFIGGLFLSQSNAIVLWQLLAVCAAMTVIFGTHAKGLWKESSVRPGAPVSRVSPNSGARSRR
jgi:O-antigen ligase